MRKDNSDFSTFFKTDKGSFSLNRDYFAYVELDDIGCWVLADGIDNSKDAMSAQLAVSNIISDFIDKPSMKKRDIKRYIKSANRALIRESSVMKLKSTILIIISDYASIRWANLGNTRIYHFRKDKINFKSRDHSLAQMMLDLGDIEEHQLDKHEERNNLTEYLGKEGVLKPYISKKQKLEDDDVILSSTSGFWEHLSDKDIEGVLKKSSDSESFVKDLEAKVLENQESLNNYSSVSLFINKKFKEKVKGDKIKKSIIAAVLAILILSGGVMAYNKVRGLRANRTNLQLAVSKLSNLREETVNKEEEGALLFSQGKYEESLAAYLQAREQYLEIKEESNFLSSRQVEEVDKRLAELRVKVRDLQTIESSFSLEEEGDQAFEGGDYNRALDRYNRSRLEYLKLAQKEVDYELLDSKIKETDNILRGISIEDEGDIFFNSKQYSVAREKYNLALNIYQDYRLVEGVNNLSEKISNINKLLEDQAYYEKGSSIEREGDRLFDENELNGANLKYTEAKMIYNNIGMDEKVLEMDRKIREVIEYNQYNEAYEYEKAGDAKLDLGNYEEALLNYRYSHRIYSRINREEEGKRVEEKVSFSEGSIRFRDSNKKGQGLRRKGDQFLEDEDYEKAEDNYREAKQIYEDLNMGEEVEELRDLKRYSTARLEEELTDKRHGNQENEKTVREYEELIDIYKELGREEDMIRVREKLSSIKNRRRFRI